MQTNSKRSAFLLLSVAWLCGLSGVLWAFFLAFASGMKTVPSMELSDFLATLPLPVISLWAGIVLFRRIRGGRAARGLQWATVPALVMGALGLVVGFGTYFGVP